MGQMKNEYHYFGWKPQWEETTWKT